MKHLPLNLSDFEQLITGDYIYVDKTQYIYNLVQGTKFHFLSRPRRFGKSLLASTLDKLFKGKKELFQNLWIFKSDYDWKIYPVIFIDFSAVGSNTSSDLKISLVNRLMEIAEEYNLEITKDHIVEDMARSLINALVKKYEKVVLLVDEYDHPLLKHIDNEEVARSILEVLKGFYHVIKSNSGKFKNIFVTGITKFSKASLFSGLNNLQDISLDSRYGTLLGYTQEEIHYYFGDFIKKIAERHNQSYDALIELMRSWYNGYKFSGKSAKVYNPFSILYFLDKGELENFWFATGTPSFLITLIKKYKYPIQNLSGSLLNILDLGTFDIGNLPLIPIFFQAGYLTIKDYNPDNQNYILDYPNKEVESSFLSYFLDQTAGVPIASVKNYVFNLQQALANDDVNLFISVLHQFLCTIPVFVYPGLQARQTTPDTAIKNRRLSAIASIIVETYYILKSDDGPYDIHIPLEKYYQSIFYVIFQLIGSYVNVEVKTNIGRIDAVVETKNNIYIFELKIDSTGSKALQQIEDNKYYERFIGLNKMIKLIGLSFDTKLKNISSDYKIQVI